VISDKPDSLTRTVVPANDDSDVQQIQFDYPDLLIDGSTQLPDINDDNMPAEMGDDPGFPLAASGQPLS